MSRSYEAALRKLASLQSNRAVTHLFDKTASQAPGDLNSAAIPEMIEWLRLAGYSPADLCRMRHIHVAGTKGKGSVCAYATAMLREQRGVGAVGTYTSPHLVSPRERIAIDGRPISRELFARCFFDLWERFGASARERGADATTASGPASKPFFFRFLTILAWHVFLREGVRDVVLECGIGGEHDATNVLPAGAVSVAVVTQLGVDHVAMLGDTVEQIAWHKAGVFKSGVRAFTLNLRDRPGVMDVLRARAREKGAAALVEVEVADVEAWGGVAGTLGGPFQKMNQALAVMAVREHLGGSAAAATPSLGGASLSPEMVRGLRTASLRGRGEVVPHEGATWLLDGAHTEESLDHVARWVAREVRPPDERLVLVFNQQERDAAALLRAFVEAMRRETGRRDVFSRAIFTRNEVVAPAPPARHDLVVQDGAAATMRTMCPGCETVVLDNVTSAVAEAKRGLDNGSGTVLVTGSLHLVGGVLQVLEPDSSL